MRRHVEGRKQLVQVGGENYWKGDRWYVVEDTQVQRESLSLWGEMYPGMSGEYAPICKKTEAIIHPNGIGGVALIIAKYETPRKPGKAFFRTARTSSLQKIVVDTEGKIIEGPDPNAPWGSWLVTKGNNRVEHWNDTVLIVETAYDKATYSLGGPMSLEGKVNDAPCSITGFGSFAAECLKCIAVVTGEEHGAGIIDVDYRFKWSGPDGTWNQKVQSQLGTWVSVITPVMEGSGVDAAQTTTIPAQRFLPGIEAVLRDDGTYELVKTEPEARTTCKTANFSVLEGLTQW